MKLLTLDAEFMDKNLQTYGLGCFFRYNYPDYPFHILGMGYITDDGEEGYTADWTKLNSLLKEHDSILCHNYLVEFGILMMLAKEGYLEWDIRSHMKYDTMILAKLENGNRLRYGLDHLGDSLCNSRKTSNKLHDWAWDSGKYQEVKLEETSRNVHTKPSDAILDKWCKTNMDLLPEELVAEYCIDDCRLTKKLFEKLLPEVEYLDLKLYSDIIEVCVSSKAKGVRIDLTKARKVYTDFIDIKLETEKSVYKEAGKEFNIGSTKQLAEVLMDAGYNLAYTDKGNPKTDRATLETLTGTMIDSVLQYRKAIKMSRDFIGKIIDYQNAIPSEYRDEDYGRIFPSMNLLGATATGRFSSGSGGSKCLEVSIHQIPARDEVFGKPCRSIFIPEEGEKWVCLDFNSQESRLQVHYAKVLGCSGIQSIVDEWNSNPLMSYHDKVADMAHISRSHAKTINLGLSYGMGEATLCAKLGMEYSEASIILQQYHDMLPFMSQLQNKCKKAFGKNKYIRTLGGRKIKLPPYRVNRNAAKDGLSRLVQGSAADQCLISMQRVWKMGLDILFTVHDEISISTSNVERDAKIVKDCMESAYELSVPVIADLGYGNNWLEGK